MRFGMLAATVLLFGTARAQTCHLDVVSTSPGEYLYTQTGQTFEIFPGRGRLSESWLPLDALRVCRLTANAYTLTDLSRHGEQVEALYLP